MALTRKFLASKGIDEDVAEEIVKAHLETVSGLKDELEQYKKMEDFAKEYYADIRDNPDLTAKEKLEKIRPTNLGQASRIPGITPADIAVLTVCLERADESLRE